MALARPELSTRVERLLERFGDNLERGVVPLSVFGDPDIFELERERIFARNWTFVAHESEIPHPGDFVARAIGDGRWIVCRDDGGTVRVLFDSCRHRGTAICRGEKGNTAAFRCPYHGWTYRTDGALIGVPNGEKAYRALDRAQWGLIAAPQIAIHNGLIWVNLDPEAPSFLEHLGAFRWYFDVHFGAASGMEVVGDPHRWVLPANWKSGAENFSGDSYHTQFLHKSIVELGLFENFASGSYDVHVTECDGHATSIRRAAPGVDSFWGYEREVHEDFAEGPLDRNQLELARASMVTVATVFPNLSLIHLRSLPAPGQAAVGFLSLRQWKARSAGETEMWNWILVPRAASAEYKALAYRTAVATFSPSGNFEQDDTIVWGSIPASGGSTFARMTEPMLNYEMGIDVPECVPIPDWPGPGIAYSSRLEEGVQRTFFRHWLREMRRP